MNRRNVLTAAPSTSAPGESVQLYNGKSVLMLLQGVLTLGRRSHMPHAAAGLPLQRKLLARVRRHAVHFVGDVQLGILSVGVCVRAEAEELLPPTRYRLLALGVGGVVAVGGRGLRTQRRC